MGNIRSESKSLENHMQNADDDGNTEQDRVGIEENFLDHLDLGTVATTRERAAKRSLTSRLLGVGLEGRHELELPAGQVVEINSKRKLLNSIVEKGHLVCQLPESVDK